MLDKKIFGRIIFRQCVICENHIFSYDCRHGVKYYCKEVEQGDKDEKKKVSYIRLRARM